MLSSISSANARPSSWSAASASSRSRSRMKRKPHTGAAKGRSRRPLIAPIPLAFRLYGEVDEAVGWERSHVAELESPLVCLREPEHRAVEIVLSVSFHEEGGVEHHDVAQIRAHQHIHRVLLEDVQQAVGLPVGLELDFRLGQLAQQELLRCG